MLSKVKDIQYVALCVLLICGLAYFQTSCRTEEGGESAAEALLRKAVQAVRIGKLDLADQLSHQGLEQTQAEPESRSYWEFKLLLIDVLIQQRQLDEAEQLLEAETPPGSEFEHLRCRWNLDWARLLIQEQGEDKLERASAFLSESQRIAQQLDSTDLLSRIESCRGLLLQRKAGNLSGSQRAELLAESESAYRAAVRLSDQTGDPALQALARGGLGFFLTDNFRYDEALSVNQEAQRFSQKCGNKYLEEKTAGNLAWCYFMLGNFNASLRLFGDAESMAKGNGLETDQHRWLGNRGMVYLRLGRLQEAVSDFREAYEIADRRQEFTWVSAWLQNLATAYIRLEDYEKAQDFNRQALSVNQELKDEDERMEADLYSYLIRADILLAQGKKEQARDLLIEILDTETEDRALLWEAEAALAGVYARLGKSGEAEKHFRKTLDSFEQARTNLHLNDLGLVITFQERSIEFQQSYVEFLMQAGRSEQALELVESSRALVLAVGLNLNPKLVGKVAQMQQAAKTLDAVLLSYWIAPERSYVWAVTADGIHDLKLPGRDDIEPQVRGYNKILQERDPLLTNNPVGVELYKTLLGPLQELLGNIQRVILVPNGVLHTLSFETLIVPGPEKHYWIDDVALALAPSLVLLQPDLEEEIRRQHSYLMMGYSPDDDPLPGVEGEIHSIEEALAPRRLVPSEFLQEDAVVQRFEESASEQLLIHFAAHAEANPESPLNSYVRLCEKLYAHRVASTKLFARLVTVSACRSAGAEAYGGEGLVGFSWAFLHAGAHNVVAGLWNVSDRSSSRLMQALYTQLAAGASPADALREAKQTLRQSGAFRYPRHWAAFQIYTRSNPFVGVFKAN